MAKPEVKKVEHPDYSEIHFEWNFPEFEQHERGKWWYICSTIVVATLVFYCIATFNFLFLVIVLLTSFIIYIYHEKEVEIIHCKITDSGIHVDRTFYMWKDISSFYIIYEPPRVKNLYLHIKMTSQPHWKWKLPIVNSSLVVPLEDQDPLSIRQHLLLFAEEDLDKETEPLSHTIGRDLKL